MSDVATVVVAITGSVTTLASGLLGYIYAGRNDEARDNRAIARDRANRIADEATKRQERIEDEAARRRQLSRDTQRELMLDLQDKLQRLSRSTFKVMDQDQKTIREHGKLFQLPDNLGGEESVAATFDVVRLTSRILDDELRRRVTDFINFCGYATTGWVVQHKGDTADALKEVINHLGNDLALKNADVMELLGVHIRRELGE